MKTHNVVFKLHVTVFIVTARIEVKLQITPEQATKAGERGVEA